MSGCGQRVEALRRRARAQADGLAILKKVFAQEAEHLRRHDQARRLDALGAEVAREVSDILMMEGAAADGFTRGTLISGAVTFALGSVIGVIAGEKRPLSVGARLAENAFTRTAPFGTVVIAVGPGGVPDEIRVIPLSQLAREVRRSESEVVAALEGRGYRLMTPQTFSTVLNELKAKVLKGVLALPVATSSLERHGEGIPGTP